MRTSHGRDRRAGIGCAALEQTGCEAGIECKTVVDLRVSAKMNIFNG